MAKAGRGWPELTKTPTLAGIITRPESKTQALAGIQNLAMLAGVESAKTRPWPGIYSASCKNLEFKLQNQKLLILQNPGLGRKSKTRPGWSEFDLQKPGLGRESAKIRPWPGIHSASCKYLELNLQNQKLRPWPGYKTRPDWPELILQNPAVKI